MALGRKTFLALFGGLAVVILMGAAWAVYHLYAPYRGYAENEKFVIIRRGSSVAQIGRLLQSEGVIRSAFFFRAFVRFRYDTPSLKAGEYRFSEPQSLAGIADTLQSGRVFYHRVTIPEGFSREEILQVLASTKLGSQSAFDAATRNSEWIRRLDPNADDLEGYLFPNTYFFSRLMVEEEMVRQMVQEFIRIWTEERQRRAEELGMTVREVVTLASLIEEETRLADERPLVSAVFHNRLKKNMPLGCDPTVIYAVKRVKTYDGTIHQSDLNIDSPYNTYRYPGLPPGPIANPGEASIQAALFPAAVDYLYFVSRNDGSHFFSTNYQDHSRAVQKYQRSNRSNLTENP